MGLDMYFYASPAGDYESFSHWDKKQGKTDRTNYPKDLKVLEDYISRVNFKSTSSRTYYQIGYFRKFNALHNYIVEKYADGVDACQEIYLSESDVKDILNNLKTVQEDFTKAKELLPTKSGFFFGCTEYDDYYKEDVNEAVNLFTKLVESFNFKKYDVIYRASW